MLEGNFNSNLRINIFGIRTVLFQTTQSVLGRLEFRINSWSSVWLRGRVRSEKYENVCHKYSKINCLELCM